MLCEHLRSVLAAAVFVSIKGTSEALLGLGWVGKVGTNCGGGHIESESKTDTSKSRTETMKEHGSLVTLLEMTGSNLMGQTK